MPHFRVYVNIEASVDYVVEAETQAEAEATALEMADDGMGFDNLDITFREVGIVNDESAEFE